MRIGHLKEQNQCLSSHRFYGETCGVCFHHSQVSPIDLKYEKYFQEQKRLDPIIPEQENHPILVLCPERWFQILLSCEKRQSVSYTSNLSAQMYDFRIVRILKQSQSAFFGTVTHMTKLFVFTNMMNIWNQSIQAFVTGLGPFCDGSCELMYWP